MNHFEFNAQSDDIRTTTVENAFLTHYMPQARGDYVKVYLYGLKCCTLGQSFSDDDIAAALDLSVSDVKKAWKTAELLAGEKELPGLRVYKTGFIYEI